MKKLMMVALVMNSASVWAGDLSVKNHTDYAIRTFYAHRGRSQGGLYHDSKEWKDKRSNKGSNEFVGYGIHLYDDKKGVRSYVIDLRAILAVEKGPLQIMIADHPTKQKDEDKLIALVLRSNGIQIATISAVPEAEWEMEEKNRARARTDKDSGDKGDDKRQRAGESELPSAPGGMGWSGDAEKLQKQLDECLQENKKLKARVEEQDNLLRALEG